MKTQTDKYSVFNQQHAAQNSQKYQLPVIQVRNRFYVNFVH